MDHIMIDGYEGNENRLDDLKTVEWFLNEAIYKLNLVPAMPPFLLPYYYPDDRNDEGISAFSILEGGHITIHTFPQRGCLFIDLLYQGYFDEEKLKKLVLQTFCCSETCLNVLRTERRVDSGVDPNRIWGKHSHPKVFGPHIIARIEDIDISFERIFDMLDTMPEKISMKPISRPYVLKTKEFYSGIVLIAQSHVAFHYDLREKVMFCDLFSCSDYNVNNFTDYLTAEFGSFEHLTLIRGSKYDKDAVSRTAKIMMFGKWYSSKEK